MAFVAAAGKRFPLWGKDCYVGTYANTTGVTSGTITVPLRAIDFFSCTGLTKFSTSTSADVTTVTVTVVNPAATVTGHWIAVGRG